jgi:HK97 family phage major capsid protein
MSTTLTPRALHEKYRRELEILRDTTRSEVERERAQSSVIELRHLIDESILSIAEDREREEDNEARARAESVAWGVTSAPPAQNGTSVRERYQRWEDAGSPGTFRIAIYPDYEHDMRAAGNTRARFEYKHEERQPNVEGMDWTRFAEKRTSAERSQRTAILTTDASTVYSSYLVPARVLESLSYHENAMSGVLKAGPTIVQTPGDELLYYPKFLTDAAATHHDEGAAATETNPVLDRMPLNAYRYDGYFSASLEDIRSSVIPMEAILQNGANRAIATATASAYADGSGSSLPQGIGGDNTTTVAGVTASSATAYSFNNLKALKNSVLPGYRANGSWLFGTDAYSLLTMLIDDNGTYQWIPSNVVGDAESLLGCPIFEEPSFNSMTANKKATVTFGDMSYFVIRNAGPVLFEANDGFQFDKFLRTFRFAKWTDSDFLGTDGAVKHMVMGAA